MNSRDQFEAWHNCKYPLHGMLLDQDGDGRYVLPSRREMLEVWQASRACATGLTAPAIFCSWRSVERGRQQAQAGDFSDIHLTYAEYIRLLEEENASLRQALSAYEEGDDE